MTNVGAPQPRQRAFSYWTGSHFLFGVGQVASNPAMGVGFIYPSTGCDATECLLRMACRPGSNRQSS